MILAINWPHVWMVTGVGFCMVICLLVVLIFILKLLGAVVSNALKAPKAAAPKAAAPQALSVAAPAAAQASADDDLAAIAMALHLYFNGVHDVEPTEIHIRKAERSGWNSKLYGMNNLHR
ncbi:MAG: OadG family protein [Bacteroidaceae bacterium]|nr:OadG family protein [Bacteroidaceae bacterium]